MQRTACATRSTTSVSGARWWRWSGSATAPRSLAPSRLRPFSSPRPETGVDKDVAAAQQDYDAIAAEITDGHEIVASKLFGMPTLKVRGKAFAGLFGEAMSFKLSPDDLAAAMKVPGAGTF